MFINTSLTEQRKLLTAQTTYSFIKVHLEVIHFCGLNFYFKDLKLTIRVVLFCLDILQLLGSIVLRAGILSAMYCVT